MTWYVNPKTGLDGNDGRSAGTAFKSLTHAIEAAKAADTIILVPGAYDQDLPRLVSAARVAGITVGVAGAD
ncbi:MAG: DUF1565 domain-containing protein [Methyloceanibacter sp.]|uniref:DUF1565 domain-containing protein n=1 Tax=Methyloceanibacter sp. TaxID=1965321 RepID=UPI003D6CAA50